MPSARSLGKLPHKINELRLPFGYFRVMPDIHALYQEQHILGDIRGMVGNPFQMPHD
jgi:hypothetical protein